jgi:hypothetical protein
MYNDPSGIFKDAFLVLREPNVDNKLHKVCAKHSGS